MLSRALALGHGVITSITSLTAVLDLCFGSHSPRSLTDTSLSRYLASRFQNSAPASMDGPIQMVEESTIALPCPGEPASARVEGGTEHSTSSKSSTGPFALEPPTHPIRQLRVEECIRSRRHDAMPLAMEDCFDDWPLEGARSLQCIFPTLARSGQWLSPVPLHMH